MDRQTPTYPTYTHTYTIPCLRLFSTYFRPSSVFVRRLCEWMVWPWLWWAGRLCCTRARDGVYAITTLAGTPDTPETDKAKRSKTLTEVLMHGLTS
mmetsp:Transcript_23590/g.58331  ORF Transcript_23590/g.58331 Transcript_23590/m.58331 type:complete len:96 (-) Transcript_23590:76-363(-)